MILLTVPLGTQSNGLAELAAAVVVMVALIMERRVLNNPVPSTR